ncbi:hypothetical protein OH146_10770 [Salinibacterium sp. SYSU T00001]|nr:hypothetical protein [Salinibacterium sedimenticola]MCW4386254.1 hypothetical protein [Salinibacterium sedimenticola]
MSDVTDPNPYKRMPQAGDSLGGTPEHTAEVGVADDGVVDWGVDGGDGD